MTPEMIAGLAAAMNAPARRAPLSPEIEAIARAVMLAESGGDPNAISPKGAKGRMQVMDATNRDPGFGVRPAADDSPEERERVGRDYLAAMLVRYQGDPELAFAAYNGGPGRVDKHLATGAPLPAETRAYVPKVMGLAGMSGGGTMSARARALSAGAPILASYSGSRSGSSASASSDISGDSGDEALAGGDSPGRDWAADLLGEPATTGPEAPAGRDWASQLGLGESVRSVPGAKFPAGPTVSDTLGKSAGFWATMRASLAPDEKDQIKRYSEAMGIPVENFGVIDGNLVYADAQGNVNRVTPSVMGGGIAEVPERLGRQVAKGVGPMLPGAAAAVAGTAMGPTGASIPAAGGAAFVTDVARQAADRALAGESPFKVDLLNSSGQGGLAMAGQGVGVGIARGFNRNPLAVGRPDRDLALDPATTQEAQRLIGQGRQVGIDLTIPEATQVPSLLQNQRQLTRMPEGADRFGNLNQERTRRQIPNAVYNFLNDVSGVQSVGEGAGMLRQGAEAAIEARTAARTAAASPAYEDAFNSGAVPDIAPIVQRIDGELRDATRTLRGPLSAIRDELVEAVPVQRAGQTVNVERPITSYRRMHNVKEEIDQQLANLDKNEAPSSAQKRAKAILTEIQEDLTARLRQAHPRYEEGYQTFRTMSGPVDEVAGIKPTGIAARDVGVDRAQNTRVMFDPKRITPEEVTRARQAYEEAGQLDQWNAGLSAFLTDRFEDASRVLASGRPGNVAGKFSAELFGDDRSRQVMQAALSPTQYQGFERLMEVLQVAGSALPEGSPTATDLPGGQALRNRYGRVARAALGLFSPQQIGIRAGEALGERMGSRGMERLAETLIDPANLDRLAQLRMFTPTSERALTITTQLLAQAGLAETGAAAPADFAPPAYGARSR